jgi:hypothetical protein
MPTFEYSVDDEPQATDQHTLTANQILTKAGIDVAIHYLVEIKGASRESYQDRGDVEIHIHQHQRFISVKTGPTPVSVP